MGKPQFATAFRNSSIAPTSLLVPGPDV
jgi:hypothetical protein